MTVAGEPPPESGLTEATRVEAFSDGVMAIAITLLVLDLQPPRARSGGLASGLLDQWPSYVAFVASFVYVGVVWVSHHALFARIRTVDRGLLWRNLLLLLPVSALPFPTATIADALRHGDGADQRAAIALYGIIAMSLACAWLSIYNHLAARPVLAQPWVAEGFFARERRRALVGIAAPCLAVAVGLVVPVAGLAVLVAMAVFYAATSDGAVSPTRR